MTERPQPGELVPNATPCLMCGSRGFVVQFTYDSLMPLEVAFEFAKADSYRREIHRCRGCGHFIEALALDQANLYASDYVTSTYHDAAGLKRTFDKIMALPPEQSDNAGRVARVLEFAQQHLPSVDNEHIPSLLDAGSGLCVFAARMRAAGWNCTAIDLDPRLVEHAKSVAKVNAQLADVATAKPLGQFDAITFNKVLEHVVDPIAMLAASQRMLKQGGFVYVEVPDGETAASEGREREEFLLGHRHVFSRRSLELLIERAGFRPATIERLVEPSGKFTLRAFLEMPQ